MKKLLFILLLFISFSSCKCQDYIAFTPIVQTYEQIKYGALYNWYAATDVRKITSSDDWVVPSAINYNTLNSYVGIDVGYKLRETGTIFWSNSDGTNTALFNARGSGYRLSTFSNLRSYWYAWTGDMGTYPAARYILTSNSLLNNATQFKNNGYSIRLLYVGEGAPTEYVGNDLKRYRIILIGSQYWLADNLAETKFRNGDYMHGFEAGTYVPISNANWAALITEGMCFYNDDPSAYK